MKYKVIVCHSEWADIEVEANSKDEAKELVNKEIQNGNVNWYDGDYNIRTEDELPF